jgi:hypothetical protein
MTRKIICVCACLASALILSEAFAPSASSRIPPITASTQLFMDKKVRKKKSTSGAGFGASAGFARPQGDSFPYAGSIRPGVQSPQRVVVSRDDIVKPDYALDGIPKKKGGSLPWVIEVKTPEEIVKMRAAGKLARNILDMAGRAVRVGVTTDEIDTLVYNAILEVSYCVLCCCF